MPQELRPGVIPIPYRKFFLRITHISETILSILAKLCPNVPWVILFQSYVRYVWGPIHHTCKTCLFFSFFLLIYKTRPNDFDLQLGCCISNAFSTFLSLFWYRYLYWQYCQHCWNLSYSYQEVTVFSLWYSWKVVIEQHSLSLSLSPDLL